jgi:hypothetical protein
MPETSIREIKRTLPVTAHICNESYTNPNDGASPFVWNKKASFASVKLVAAIDNVVEIQDASANYTEFTFEDGTGTIRGRCHGPTIIATGQHKQYMHIRGRLELDPISSTLESECITTAKYIVIQAMRTVTLHNEIAHHRLQVLASFLHHE